jgi:hypothetical protein
MLIEAESSQNSKFEPIQAATQQPTESAKDQSSEGNGEMAVEASPHSSLVRTNDDVVQENTMVVAATDVVNSTPSPQTDSTNSHLKSFIEQVTKAR